jgi:benzoate/toluate 1,2-dioxygenase alpha subunit
MRKARYRGNVWGTAQGHGILDAPSLSPEGFLNGRFGEFYKARLAEYGEEEFKWMVGRSIASIFPNVGMIHQQIRTWRPIAPDLTEVTIYPFDLAGAPAELNEGMIHAQERFYAPSGHGAPDDVEMFASNQHGLDGRSVEWLILERGVDTDDHLEDGDCRGQPSSEACQRGFWRKWEQLMTGR